MPKVLMTFSLDEDIADKLRKEYRANMSYKVNQVLREALLKRRRSG
ncbi:MAG: hypothetical protein ACXABY_25700 [Candidatus Thorarchaeota archaeon]|jgi:hypothetical protein